MRRLEDRILELCAKSITAGEDELTIISDLRAALREHVERVRKIVAATDFDSAKDRLRLERRSKQQESRELRFGASAGNVGEKTEVWITRPE